MKRPQYVYTIDSVEYDFTSRTHIMGIVNVTPDSFSDGGKYLDVDRAVAHGLALVDEGADFLDIGGESTRPGSDPVNADEEMRRVLPVIEQLKKHCHVPLSIDTYKSTVADAALGAGAVIVNDISGLTYDPNMAARIVYHRAALILMHMMGTPKTMQEHPHYNDVTQEVKSFLSRQAQQAKDAGIHQIIIDPGIGFGKTFEHNIRLLRELQILCELPYPLLVGVSRKSFIGNILNLPPEERLEGTAAATAVSILRGAHIIRVHDVQTMKRVARVTDALK